MRIEINASPEKVKGEISERLNFNWCWVRTFARSMYTGMRLGRFFGVRFVGEQYWFRALFPTYIYDYISGKGGNTSVKTFKWYGISFTSWLLFFLIDICAILLLELGRGQEFIERAGAGYFLLLAGVMFAVSVGSAIVHMVINFFICRLSDTLTWQGDVTEAFISEVVKPACEDKDTKTE